MMVVWWRRERKCIIIYIHILVKVPLDMWARALIDQFALERGWGMVTSRAHTIRTWIRT